MGYYKRISDNQSEVRRYNAARRRANKLDDSSPRLIRLESISETERYHMAQDVERALEFNKAIEQWQNRVTLQLRATIAPRSSRVARELIPKAYTDKYGLINRLGFSFPRHGIYIHKGAGRGQGGYSGSKWNLLKTVNGVPIDTHIVRHTNPQSLGKQNSNNRPAFEWFDPVIRKHLPALANIVTRYFDTMIIDATRIYIDK